MWFTIFTPKEISLINNLKLWFLFYGDLRTLLHIKWKKLLELNTFLTKNSFLLREFKGIHNFERKLRE